MQLTGFSSIQDFIFAKYSYADKNHRITTQKDTSRRKTQINGRKLQLRISGKLISNFGTQQVNRKLTETD